MNTPIKIFLATFWLVFFSGAFASGTTTHDSSVNSEPLMVFQIIQNQLVIDRSMIESATLIPPSSPTDSYGLRIKLTPTVADQIERLSEENVGKQLMMILNGVVISSPTIQSKLGAEFQITGLTQQQSKQFVNSLSLTK